MHKSSFSTCSAPYFKRSEVKQKTYTDTRDEILDFLDEEALLIFNQVTENKSRLLTRKSTETFYSKKTVKSRKFDSKGKEIIENFEAISYGGFTKDGQKVGELVQQYSNEKTGLTKTSLQRNFGCKLRRTQVKLSAEFQSIEEYNENFDRDFEKEWKNGAKDLGVKRVLGFERQLEVVSPKGL